MFQRASALTRKHIVAQKRINFIPNDALDYFIDRLCLVTKRSRTAQVLYMLEQYAKYHDYIEKNNVEEVSGIIHTDTINEF